MSSANPIAPNRAELLRQRRSTTTGKTHQPHVSQMARKPVKSQPVMVRNVSMPASQPFRKTRQVKPRRQFYYSLGATGAELRLPALPMIHPGWRVISMLVTTLLVFALYTLYNNPMFTVSKVDIAGLQRINPADVESILDVNGLSIIAVQPKQAIEKLALAFPELTDIQVTVAFPANVGVSAHERQPKVAWTVNDETFWIDQEGVLIPPRGEPTEPLFTIQSNGEPPLVSVPVTGEPTGEEASLPAKGKARLSPAELAAVVEPAQSLWGRQVDLSILQAAEQLRPSIPPESNLVYNRTSGLGWTDPRGWQVFVGRTLDNIDLKLVEYQAVVEKLNQQGIVPSMISVEHLHAPFYRTEP